MRGRVAGGWLRGRPRAAAPGGTTSSAYVPRATTARCVLLLLVVLAADSRGWWWAARCWCVVPWCVVGSGACHLVLLGAVRIMYFLLRSEQLIVNRDRYFRPK